MNITAVAIGSTGDIRPFLALGHALSQRGHNLKIATFPRFQTLIERHGFAFAPIHGDEDLMMTLLIGDGVTGLAYLKGLSTLLNNNKTEILDDVYRACQSTDLILYTILGSLAYHVAESLKIPCMRAIFCPLDKTGDFPVPSMATWLTGRWYNRLTYTLSDLGFSLFTIRELDDWRVRLGLEKWAGHTYHKMFGKPVETLYAYSQYLAPKPKEWGEHLHITGYWHTEEKTSPPSDEKLLRFLESGDSPIYIGFGSMVGGSFQEMQRIILDGLKNTGQRAVLSSGWRKFGAVEHLADVYCVDYVAHDWLFPRVKAVVHHGGAGTTAAGLRAGKPTLVLYFGGDQPFWGNQIYLSGAGPKPVARKMLTADLFTERLRQLVDDRMRKNAERIATQLNKEDGCQHACDIIERCKWN